MPCVYLDSDESFCLRSWRSNEQERKHNSRQAQNYISLTIQSIYSRTQYARPGFERYTSGAHTVHLFHIYTFVFVCSIAGSLTVTRAYRIVSNALTVDVEYRLASNLILTS